MLESEDPQALVQADTSIGPARGGPQELRLHDRLTMNNVFCYGTRRICATSPRRKRLESYLGIDIGSVHEPVVIMRMATW